MMVLNGGIEVPVTLEIVEPGARYLDRLRMGDLVIEIDHVVRAVDGGAEVTVSTVIDRPGRRRHRPDGHRRRPEGDGGARRDGRGPRLGSSASRAASAWIRIDSGCLRGHVRSDGTSGRSTDELRPAGRPGQREDLADHAGRSGT